MNSDSSRTVILSIASSRSSWVSVAMGSFSCGCVSGLCVSGGLAGGLLGGGLLVGDLLQGVAQAAQRRAEQSGQSADRCLHPSGKLGQQDLARRQGRQADDVIATDRAIT